MIQQRFIVAAVIHKRSKILIDDFVIVWELIRWNKIASADFGAVDLQFSCRKIKHSFNDKYTMLTSRAAIRRDNRLVRENRCEFTIVILYIIGAKQGALRIKRNGQTIRSIRARVVQENIMH